MKRLISSLLVAVFIALVGVSSGTVCAQAGAAARGLARELAEALGKRSSAELLEVGGEAVVRETLEKAASEGGEQLAKEVASYAERYGARSLLAFREAPAAMAASMRKLPPELSESAMRAAAREPGVIAKLATEIGEDALAAAAKHPGVGADVARKLGAEGAKTARTLSTQEVIRLARVSDDLAALPAAERAGILARVTKAPTKALEWLEKNPNLLKTAATTGVVLVALDGLIGDKEAPGLLERLSSSVMQNFNIPIGIAIVLVAGLWGARGLWRRRLAKKQPAVG